MAIIEKLLTFRIEQQNFAVPLDVVDVVINIVEIDKLPHSSQCILGVIKYYGDVIPVINLRYLFQLKSREIEVSDKLIIVKAKNQTICLWIDNVCDIINLDSDNIKKNNDYFMELDYIEDIFILNKDIVFLQNVDNIFTKDEMQNLRKLISKYKQDKNDKKLNLSNKKAPMQKKQSSDNDTRKPTRKTTKNEKTD